MPVVPHRVVVIDNQKIVRQGLREIINHVADVQVIGDSEGTAAVARVHELKPDVILMDAQLPDFDHGLTILAALRAAAPDARVVVMVTPDVDSNLIYRAIRGGAVGCILKTNSDVDEVIMAIRKVALGEVFLSSSALSNLVETIGSQAVPLPGANGTAPEELTSREKDVLELVAQGYTNREIGDRLAIAEGTVRSHLHKILDKLQLTNRVQAAAFALRRPAVKGTGILRGNSRSAAYR